MCQFGLIWPHSSDPALLSWPMSTNPTARRGAILTAFLIGLMSLAGLGTAVFVLLTGLSGGGCDGVGAAAGTAVGIALGPPRTGETVGATEYGGPGDPGSGSVGSSGTNLLAQPDSYAELG